jgi:uncharacterized repeat protein (TIGR03833 family)
VNPCGEGVGPKVILETFFSYAQAGGSFMNGQQRKDIRAGITVEVVMKKDQRAGKRTRGIVKEILTNSPSHPHGIKVRLESGEVGRVQEIIDPPAT